jgi:hypothetical protein
LIKASNSAIALSTFGKTSTSGYATANNYLQIGAGENATSSTRLIGFGYSITANTNQPAYIGYIETSNTGETKGSLIFGTRDVTTDTAPTERMRITSGGDVGIGTTPASGVRLHVSGGVIRSIDTYNNTSANVANMYVSSGGTFERATASSKRFKENIMDWNGNGLNTILALKPVTFTYKKEYYNKANIDFLGLIAEDVAQVSPYLAEYENEDRTGKVENVRYATIVVPLIKAVQELSAQIKELQTEIQTLKNK